MVVPVEITEPVAKKLRVGTYPEYCVNNAKPLLLGYYRFGSLMVRCLNFSDMQGKILPHIIDVIENAHDVLSAQVESVETITGEDAAFAPARGAIQVHAERVELGASDASRLLVKQATSVAPEEAKGLQGKVVLRTIIGTDGGVEDVRLVSSTDPSLALSAFKSVSQRQYKPYRVNGVPAPIETTVDIDFAHKE
jgi:TonB family protein